MVFNKIDLIDEKKLAKIKQKYAQEDSLFISVHDEL
jgi:ribosome biogenesis GTPase A